MLGWRGGTHGGELLGDQRVVNLVGERRVDGGSVAKDVEGVGRGGNVGWAGDVSTVEEGSQTRRYRVGCDPGEDGADGAVEVEQYVLDVGQQGDQLARRRGVVVHGAKGRPTVVHMLSNQARACSTY